MIASRVRKRYADFRFSGKFFLKISFLIVSVIFLACVYNSTYTHHFFPIKKVQILGVNYSSREEIEHLLSPLVHKDYFNVSVSAIRERLLQSEWISDAHVKRYWPNQIRIQIIEKNPIARWNKFALLSEAGEIFHPRIQGPHYPENLPEFLGPSGKHVFILEQYAKMNTVLRPLHFKIVQLELTPTESWNLIFDNGIKLSLGYKDVLTKIVHFVKVYPKIVGNRAADVDYIDLRYANGLAVRWKSVT